MTKDTEAKRDEAAIARSVVAELQRLGYTTHDEVSMGYGGERADIVGLLDGLTVIVECKASMSLTLMNQLLRWQGKAHRVIGAVGYGRDRGAAERFFRSEGFGLWNCSGAWGEGAIVEAVAPRLCRRPDPKWHGFIRKKCVEQNRSGAGDAVAGTNTGGYHTPFRNTAKLIADHVRLTPGVALADALDAVGHHYSSAKSARAHLPKCIERGIVPGVRMERDGKAIRLFPVTKEGTADGRS